MAARALPSKEQTAMSSRKCSSAAGVPAPARATAAAAAHRASWRWTALGGCQTMVVRDLGESRLARARGEL